jgi:hypothetical protein
MVRRLAPLAAMAAFLAMGCGGDDDPQPAATTPELTVPGEDAPTLEERPERRRTSRERESTTGGGGTEGGAGPTGGAPAPQTGGTPAPAPAPQQPQDTPQMDTPPPQGSPAERFEDFCSDNPGAC